MLYLISYDLRFGASTDDYARIAAVIEGLGGRRLLLSQFGLRSNLTTSQIRDYVRTSMDANDRLVVVQVADWSSFNAMFDLNTI